MKRMNKTIRKLRPVAKNCQYCHTKTEPDYKDASLSKFLTERGKILGRTRTGICSKHQRVVTQEIKRARHVALLPFVVQG